MIDLACLKVEFLIRVRVHMYGGGGILFLGRGHGKTYGSEKSRSPMCERQNGVNKL